MKRHRTRSCMEERVAAQQAGSGMHTPPASVSRPRARRRRAALSSEPLMCDGLGSTRADLPAGGGSPAAAHGCAANADVAPTAGVDTPLPASPHAAGHARGGRSISHGRHPHLPLHRALATTPRAPPHAVLAARRRARAGPGTRRTFQPLTRPPCARAPRSPSADARPWGL